jgi:hypothetical protein
MDYFRGQLTSYGQWVEVPGAGLCWQPAVPAGWRPYYDGGHWVHTDQGWYWQSDYPWGDISFHYGRWSYNPGYGWIWAPGFEFAPAWVVWRHTDEYCGWAPLPFGTVLVEGAWRFNGIRVGVDFDFGLSAGFFSFVACDHFWEHDFRRFIVPRERVALVFRQSRVINTYHLDHGRFVNEGIRVERMAQLSHRDIRDIRRETVRATEVRAQEFRRNEQERRTDRSLAASGHKVQATRTVPAARPETRREAAPSRTGEARTSEAAKTSRPSASERGAATGRGEAAKTSRSSASERGAATGRGEAAKTSRPSASERGAGTEKGEAARTSRSSTSERSTSRESTSKAKSSGSQGEREQEKERR